MRSDADRLGDILQAIAKVRERTAISLDTFDHDEMLQVWVIHHLQVVGEAARGLSQGLRDQHPEVPWPQIVALRNILTHEYFGINLHQVWEMVRKELPELDAQIRRILASFGPLGDE